MFFDFFSGVCKFRVRSEWYSTCKYVVNDPFPSPPHTQTNTHVPTQTQTCTDHAVKELDIFVKNFYEKNNVSQKR